MAEDPWRGLAILRRCRDCGEWRSLRKFHPGGHGRRGLRPQCNRCRMRLRRGLPVNAAPMNPSGRNKLWLTVLEPLRPEEMAQQAPRYSAAAQERWHAHVQAEQAAQQPAESSAA